MIAELFDPGSTFCYAVGVAMGYWLAGGFKREKREETCAQCGDVARATRRFPIWKDGVPTRRWVCGTCVFRAPVTKDLP